LQAPRRPGRTTVPGSAVSSAGMSPFWIWTQAAIVVFVLAGMVIAITKLV
jgi:hypothetical protein